MFYLLQLYIFQCLVAGTGVFSTFYNANAKSTHELGLKLDRANG